MAGVTVEDFVCADEMDVDAGYSVRRISRSLCLRRDRLLFDTDRESAVATEGVKWGKKERLKGSTNPI